MSNKSSIKKSELKKLTKAVLNEILLPDQPPRNIIDLLQKISHHAEMVMEEPEELKSVSKSKRLSSRMIKDMSKSIKQTIGFKIKSDEQSMEKSKLFTSHAASALFDLRGIWTQKIEAKDSSKSYVIKSLVMSIRGHMKEFFSQAKVVMDSIIVYKNYINAQKEIRHLDEISNNLNESINELFEIALQVGLPK